jgi:hypothetical protein
LKDQLYCLKSFLQRILNFAKMQLIFQHFSNKFDVSLNFSKLMIYLRTLLRIYEKESNPKKFLKN